jgi:RNA:NAD 2'-phosphotransferase (TPT1/KptA family)
MPTKLSGSTRGRTGMRRRWRSSSRCARQPGARREAPVILTVDAAAMHAAGHAFYQAANGVWLTDHVLPGDLSGWPG